MTRDESGWRLRIEHRTGLSYAGKVTSSYNEARMTPQTNDRQTVLDSRVAVDPPAPTYRYWDYWGTHVTSFDLKAPHEALAVRATAVVETGSGPPPDAALSWAELATPAAVDRWCEYLIPTVRTALDEELTARALEFRAAAATPAELARTVSGWVRDEMTYEPGATGVRTSATEAWLARKGVCQDLSHLTIGLLRAAGVPTRYVSGYLHPRRSGPLGVTVTGQSHAWVEWWDGGWCAFDPTNGVPLGPQHVVIGRGRDYGDVSPLKGVYAGPKSTANAVIVEVTRLR